MREIWVAQDNGNIHLIVDGEVSSPSSPTHGAYLIEYLLKQRNDIAQQIYTLNQLENIINEDIGKLRVDAEFAETYLEQVEKRYD